MDGLRRALWPLPAVWLLCCGAGGCPTSPADDDTTDPGDDDTTDHPGVDPLDLDTLIGRIQLLENAVEGDEVDTYTYISVWGLIQAPLPTGMFPEWSAGWTGESWEVVGEEGGCLVARIQWPSPCEPPCSFETEFCSPAGACLPFPEYHDAGTFTFGGLTVSYTIDPNDSGIYVPMDPLPEDLFVGGAALTLSASGGTTPGFSAAITGVPSMAPTAPCDVQMEQGQDLTVTWTPAAPDTSMVRWEMAQGHHAGNGPLLRCEGPDTGSLTVPGSMVGLYGLEQPGWQTLILSRFDRSTVEVAPGETVAFEAVSSRICLPAW